VTTIEVPLATLLGRLAEEAACTGEGPGAGAVEEGIAAAVTALRARPPLFPEVDPRLLAVVGDVSRPLPRRVAVLAHLHRVLSRAR
jgi:hypothetical protein